MSVNRVRDRSPEVVMALPPVDAVDSLAPEALVNVATQTAALHARAMARLANSQSSPSSNRDEYLDAREIAERLRVSEAYVYELIKTGQLPAIAFGKYRRVSHIDFRTWASQHKIDVPEYLTYRAGHDRRRGADDPATTRPDARSARRDGRRRGEQRGTVGTRRTRHPRVGSAPDAHPGEAAATDTPLDEAEDLTDGVHS